MRGEARMRHSTGMLPPLKDGEQESTLEAYPGSLPTLGLNKYKNVDLKASEKYPNPYKVQRHQSSRDGVQKRRYHKYRADHHEEEIFSEVLMPAPNDRIHSEKLLVYNEQERKFKDIEKLEREGLKVWQKEKVSMPNRAGAVAAVRNIPRHKAAKLK